MVDPWQSVQYGARSLPAEVIHAVPADVVLLGNLGVAVRAVDLTDGSQGRFSRGSMSAWHFTHGIVLCADPCKTSGSVNSEIVSPSTVLLNTSSRWHLRHALSESVIATVSLRAMCGRWQSVQAGMAPGSFSQSSPRITWACTLSIFEWHFMQVPAMLRGEIDARGSVCGRIEWPCGSPSRWP